MRDDAYATSIQIRFVLKLPNSRPMEQRVKMESPFEAASDLIFWQIPSRKRHADIHFDRRGCGLPGGSPAESTVRNLQGRSDVAPKEMAPNARRYVFAIAENVDPAVDRQQQRFVDRIVEQSRRSLASRNLSIVHNPYERNRGDCWNRTRFDHPTGLLSDPGGKSSPGFPRKRDVEIIGFGDGHDLKFRP